MTCLQPELVKLTCIYSESFVKEFPYLNGLNQNYIENKTLSYSDDTDKVLAKLTDQSIEFQSFLKKNNFKNIGEYISQQNKFTEPENQENKFANHPYKIVLISNFPLGFTEESAFLLLNLLKNIERTGTHIIMSLDVGIKPPYRSELLENLLSQMIGVYQERGKYFKIKNLSGAEKVFNEKFHLNLDTQIPENIEDIIKNINSISKTEQVPVAKEQPAKKLITEKPFEEIKVDISELLPLKNWTGDSSERLKIPIGKISGNDIKHLVLGQDSEEPALGVYHALIAGITGSGKSTLLHSIINISSYIYSPDELQFFLMDYKKGIEFKIYKNLPHISFFSSSNERNAGVNVLTQLTEEIEKREKLFQFYENAHDFTSYRKISGRPLPRIVVIIYDFQVLLNGKDHISEKVKHLLDNLLRVGRSFGIHIILSTHNIQVVDLENLSNIGLRIALKMPETDSIITLSKDNPAASFLGKAGEAIYNSQNGLVEGNIKFNFPYLNNEMISSMVKKLAEDSKARFNESQLKEQIIDQSVSTNLEDNNELIEKIKNNSFSINEDFCDIFIGKPVFVQDKHVFFRLRRQIESNMVMICQDLESAVSILGISLFQIIKQSTPDSRFYILDLFNVDSEFKGSFEFLKNFNKNCFIGETRNIEAYINEIIEELDSRLEDYKNKNRVILAIANLQNARKKLGQKSSSDIGRKFMKIISEGPEVGIHTILFSENFNTIENHIDPQFINEFENRIALKGGESLNILENYTSLDIANNGSGLLQFPYSKYGKDSFRVYNFKNFLEIAKNG